MKKEGTASTLQRIRALLEEPKPDIPQALAEIKSLMLQGPCIREISEVKEAVVLILERLTLPALTGERERQARVHKMIRAFRKPDRQNAAEFSALVEEIAPWIAAAACHGKRGELPPSFPPDPAEAALRALGLWESEETPGTASGEKNETTRWREIHRLLGRIISQERRGRVTWARERKGIQDAVAALAEDLVESSLIISRKEGAGETWSHGLAEEILTRPDAVFDALMAEERGFWTRVREVETALTRSQEVVSQFQNLLRRAEHALMDTRDETLVDLYTGLPNRFAFLARLARALEPEPGEKHPKQPFSVIFIRVDDYPEMIRSLGRERVNRVMPALASKIAALPRPEDYLARWSDETFALLCPNALSATAAALAITMQAGLNNPQFELSDALVSVRLGFGVVTHQNDMTEERLLTLAEVESRAALEEGAKPVQVAKESARA